MLIEKQKEYQIEYRKKNAERLKEYFKQRYKLLSDEINKKSRQRRIDNPEHSKELDRKSYEKNKESKLAHASEYKKNNRDKYNEYNRLWRINNPDLAKIKYKECYDTHKEKESNRKRKYYKNNKDKVLIRTKKWAQNNKKKLNLYVLNRRALQKYNGTFKFDNKDLIHKFNMQNGSCYWCNCKLDKYHIDHVIPLKRGGRHSIGNTVLACPKCNQTKNDSLPVVFKIRNNIKF